MSTILQEKLQKSRMSSRQSSDMLASSSQGSRAAGSSSPARVRRPETSGGPGPARQKKSLGVKEMEETLSTLHKQNFDLKLELFHRRERQSVLEERLEKLEREKAERDEMNDLLIQELEKRDKAVEEAVAMIVSLEARVEQLLREREMVHQVEADGTSHPRTTSPVAAPSDADAPDASTLNSVPSFVSDQSENTENLRDVYLGSRDSTLCLPKLVEDTPDTTRMDPRLDSPALSVLSESSFVSIYAGGRTVGLSSPPGNSPWLLDGPSRNRMPAPESPTRVKTSTTPQPRRSAGSRAPSIGNAQFHNISDVLEMGPSPLQRLEDLDATHATIDGMAESPKSTHDKKSPPAQSSRPQGQRKSKKEKREALAKVLTQGDFGSPHTLPPTPDTLSTSTLSNPNAPNDAENNPATSDTAASQSSNCDERAAAADAQPQAAQPSSAGPVDRRQTSAIDTNFEASSIGFQSRRHRRDSTASTTSSVDTWLLESLKPESNDAANTITGMLDAIGASEHSPPAETMVAPSPPDRRSSLFAKTVSAAPDAGAGADKPQSPPRPSTISTLLKNPLRGGKARSSSVNVQPPSDDLTKLGLNQTRATTVPPRQVHAPPPPKHQTPGQPETQQSQQQSSQKQRHYPPTASQASRPRPRGLNSFFRRSTGSADVPAPPASAPPTETAFRPPPPAPEAMMGIPSWVRRGSVPAVGVDDEEAGRVGATPPPILRKKTGPSPVNATIRRVENDDEGGVVLEPNGDGASGGGAPVGVIPGPRSASASKAVRRPRTSGGGKGNADGGVPINFNNGNRSKWPLGLGRVSSLRNRAA